MMNTMASTTSTGNNASSSGEENTAETKRRSLILSGATSGSGQVQMIGNMLKKPLNAAEKMMTNKLKAASSKLDMSGSTGKQCTFYKKSLLRNWVLQSTSSYSYREVPEGRESCNCMTSALQNQFCDKDFL